MNGPRVAIVGAGLMGRWHAHAARRAGGRVVAVVDPVVVSARAIAGVAAPVFESIEAALRIPIEVVHICTPLDSHVALCRQALAAGCHVIVEKPATPSLADAKELVAEARAAGRLLVPVHQFAFQDGVRRIVARRQAIGPLRHVEFATCSAGGDGPNAPDRDVVAAEIVPHAFSLARTLLSTTVSTLPWRLERAAPGEWRFAATTADGCTIAGLISLSSRPTFATCRVLGEHGSAVADLFHGYAVFEPDTVARVYKVVRPLALGLGTAGAAAWHLAGRAMRGEQAYPGLRALCAASYAAMSGESATPFRDDELVDVAAARDRLIELAKAPDGR